MGLSVTCRLHHVRRHRQRRRGEVVHVDLQRLQRVLSTRCELPAAQIRAQRGDGNEARGDHRQGAEGAEGGGCAAAEVVAGTLAEKGAAAGPAEAGAEGREGEEEERDDERDNHGSAARPGEGRPVGGEARIEAADVEVHRVGGIGARGDGERDPGAEVGGGIGAEEGGEGVGAREEGRPRALEEVDERGALGVVRWSLVDHVAAEGARREEVTRVGPWRSLRGTPERDTGQ